MTCDRGDRVQKLFILLIVAGLLPLGACFKRGQEIIQPTISISMAQINTSLIAGQAQLISATVYDQSGHGVTWSVTPTNLGTLSTPTFDAATITASVTYTAPAILTVPVTVTVTATSITNPNVTSSIALHCSPISVSIDNINLVPEAAQTIGPGEQLISAALVRNDLSNLGVTWSLSPSAGAGTISTSVLNGTFYGLYMSPPTVSAPITVLVTATSVADPAVAASLQITVLPSSGGYNGGGYNVAALNVNGGPVPGQVHPNGAFASVTLCNPGSSTCQAVDGVLVDTGSYGLRILQSLIPALNLPAAKDPLGDVLENCASLPDGSVLWGAVETADVYIAGEVATSLPIQVIPTTPGTVPDGCSRTGAFTITTPQLLGANGILGIGPEPTDCTLSGINYCDGSHQSTPPNVYYSCPSTGCGTSASPVVVGTLLQVSNPVLSFYPDSNGVVIQLPSVSDPQASAIGSLTFGIGTESNNSLGSATVLTLDASDNFTTMFNGQTLTSAFIDSGSNALFFPDSSMPACTVNTDFYCPTSPVMLSATNMGATQGQSMVDFTVEDADSLLSAFPQYSVFDTLAGPTGSDGSCSQGGAACIFDWGLPFFYDRTVFMAIDGQTVFNAPAGPWWAY
jgi:hypothetical protein